MPLRMVRFYICSLCREEFEEQPLQTWTVDGPPGAYQFDLCKVCVDEGGDWATLLERGTTGASVKKPKQKQPVAADEVSCPDCGEVFSDKGLGLHRSKAHGRVAPSVAAKEAMRKRAEVSGIPCPAPGCEFKANKPQGLAAHRRVAHAAKAAAPPRARKS